MVVVVVIIPGVPSNMFSDGFNIVVVAAFIVLMRLSETKTGNMSPDVVSCPSSGDDKPR